VLARRGRPVTTCYFLVAGACVVLGSVEDGRSVAIAALGRDGVSSLDCVVGEAGAFDTIAVTPGEAVSLAPERIRHLMADHPRFDAAVRRFAHTLLSHAVQSAACHRLHSVRQRTCRWLLALSHASGTRTLPLTHASFARLVGSARPTISEAAASLEREGAVRWSHGHAELRDVALLSRRACACDRLLRRDAAGARLSPR
jgi:CRP-like cAMP-binding protein